MIGGLDSRGWVAALIVLALAIAMTRLVLWRRSAAPEARGPRWRVALLIALQATVGVSLYLVLLPPTAPLRSGVLVVATGGAPRTIDIAAGETLVALPEAGEIEGAERAPDLATALRRFPGSARIRVEGDSLSARDQGSALLPLDFDPPPRPRGLVDLALPGWTAPGAPFSVGGQVGTLATGTVELVDPANAVVDRARVGAGRRFVVASHARAAGLALFTLRLRDPAGVLVEQVAVPVETRAQAQPRVLVLAGAPSAETKYLRRWAADAGIDLSIAIDVGGGVQLGDRPVPLTRAALADMDLLVIDDRRWETLDAGARQAVTAAVDGGLGLLLRPTGPLSASTRRDWAVLGLPVTGGGAARPVRLDSNDPKASEADSDATELELARRDIGHEGPLAVSLLRDAKGVALASWRSRGSGRIGVWIVSDSYVLVLAGHPDRYAEIWSELFSALARPTDSPRVRVDGFARADARLSLCELTGEASVVEPDRSAKNLFVDPATGERSCAAYWPERSGWHLLRDGAGGETPFYVHPADAAPALRAAENRDATLALAGAVRPDERGPNVLRAPGSPWPWFALLLVAFASLWGLERSRFGRGERPEASQDAAAKSI